MRSRRWMGLLGGAVLGAFAIAALAMWGIERSEAADHLDPPARAGLDGDRAADIADYFIWHQGSGTSATVVAILTFDGPNEPAVGQAVSCDRDVLYTMHFDTDGDNVSNIDVHARFGSDDQGNCFVRFENVPGLGGARLEGPVETVITRTGIRGFAGLRDDPFFFDLTGFRDTLTTGDLSFVSDRDFFAGRNGSALVLEFPLAAVSPTGGAFQTWATTARIGG